jgi:DNA-binding HxlR family transcriptional regulator
MTGRPTNWERFSSQRPRVITKLTVLYKELRYKIPKIEPKWITDTLKLIFKKIK